MLLSTTMRRKSETVSSAGIRIDYRAAPGGVFKGRLRVAGDKSISHRSVMLGSLAEGVTHVTGLLEGEDVLCTLAAFRAMGVQAQGPAQGKLTIQGVGLHGLRPPAQPLDMGNSGTAMRLMAGILAGQKFDSVLMLLFAIRIASLRWVPLPPFPLIRTSPPPVAEIAAAFSSIPRFSTPCETSLPKPVNDNSPPLSSRTTVSRPDTPTPPPWRTRSPSTTPRTCGFTTT